MINWKVRIKNKVFWISLVPALIVLIETVACLFGFELDLAGLGNKLLAVIEAVFLVLAIVGIVADPTTTGIKDSTQALTYEHPKEE